jgi:glycosyltransferase involved in cell wall biosynthesis
VKYPSALGRLGSGHGNLDASFVPPSDVDVEYINYPAIPYLSRPFNGGMAARALLPYVRKFAPDLITSYCLYPDGYAALQIGEALRLPVIVKGVGSDVHGIPDRFAARHTRTVLRKADLVTMVSQDLRKRAIAMGSPPEKTLTISNGCDTEVFFPSDKLTARAALEIEPDAEVVVYVGRMDLKKGLRELVKAAAALHAQRPRLRVFMVGDGPDKPIIDEAIRAHEAGAYVRTAPPCAFDIVPLWNAAADVVTLPSYMEGYPNAVLEAIASGRPVVATDVGGIPEIMGSECGCLVPPRDSVALARALESVLNRSWDAHAIAGTQGRSWNRVAEEMMEINDRIISEYKARSDAR